jgi:hypothetical protein
MAVGLLSAGLIVPFARSATAENSVRRSDQAVEIARLRLKLYERVDYPLRLRHLRTEIKLMEARVSSLGRRVKESRRFYRSPALFTTIEKLQLSLLEAELVLKDLKHERTLLQSHNKDERRLRMLQIEIAARPVR